LNRNRLDREVVEAATLHRYCGLGVVVPRQMEHSEVCEPAQSYLLGAGFSRAGGRSRSFASLRMTNLPDLRMTNLPDLRMTNLPDLRMTNLPNLRMTNLLNSRVTNPRGLRCLFWLFLAPKFLKVNINERGLYEA
jgi:hypothetical protein